MPIIDVTMAEGVISEQATAALVQKVTDLVTKYESGPVLANDFFDRYPRIAWTFIKKLPPDGFAVAGRLRDAMKKPLYQIVVGVPTGSLNDRRKAGLIEEVTRAVVEAEGSPTYETSRFRVRVIINEIPDGNFGAGGQIWRLRDLMDYFGLDPQSERYQELVAAQQRVEEAWTA